MVQENVQTLEEANKYDHRELNKKQELFYFDPMSPGSCFFLPHGAREIWSPDIYKMQLWETSGHAAKYKENMFVFEIDDKAVDQFGLKPVNCPGHYLVFGHRVRSYRELPLRLADFGALHRNEASGALTSLTRLRPFHQDDAHIFCRESQIKDEVKGVLDFISYVYTIFGLKSISETYKVGDALAEALNEFGKPWEINKGDGAFFGPKIDISVSDAMKRNLQCATLQLERFNLLYVAENNQIRERPVMIHRAILGSVERMFATLFEHYKGKWPFWLSPCQAIVCPVSNKSQACAFEIWKRLHDARYHVDIDVSDKTVGKKVREAQLVQYNYVLVVGEEEANNGQVSVRIRDRRDHQVMTVDELLGQFKDMVASFQ
ncbi:hypothetical protein R3W88_020829 [Solanum pinnatisectum]|uniref:threonine--tRNA ligase n=1 Tax=Solanum pinnatisectum TaxID=50273 RepID=A0AAV9KNF2_9SOLN|nr:hypothetical protein R3W88_020829 [Solanum pinnatisectum]